MRPVPPGRTIGAMRETRVLVACDLTSYREAIATALDGLRPDLDVHVAPPEDLDRRAEELRPDLVVCSRITRRVEELARGWVELYPGCEAHAVVSLAGERSTIEDMQLADLLSVVDRLRHAPPVQGHRSRGMA